MLQQVDSVQTGPQGNVLDALERDGIVILPDFIPPHQFVPMQKAFESRLQRIRWNNAEGYEKTERYRRMINDVLLLEQGFVDAALHPIVKETLRSYIPNFALVEAKGWLSIATLKNFHGWHGDMWYDQTQVTHVPRECKLAIYLTDVDSGAFNYVKGSHRKKAPRTYSRSETANVDQKDIVQVLGKAGTAFLFDTSGMHRQAYPILKPRQAVFYCYHDPSIPIQKEDIDYYRYHPLLLNAAFLGDLSEEDRTILGFGEKANYVPTFQRAREHPIIEKAIEKLLGLSLLGGEWKERIGRKFHSLALRRQ